MIDLAKASIEPAKASKEDWRKHETYMEARRKEERQNEKEEPKAKAKPKQAE